jgi:hypothetical protein
LREYSIRGALAKFETLGSYAEDKTRKRSLSCAGPRGVWRCQANFQVQSGRPRIPRARDYICKAGAPDGASAHKIPQRYPRKQWQACLAAPHPEPLTREWSPTILLVRILCWGTTPDESVTSLGKVFGVPFTRLSPD